MASSGQDLGKAPLGKLLISMAVPAIIAQLINALYNIVDRIFIGRMEGIGTDALTGVGITLPIIMLITAFSGLIGFGGAPKAAIKMGAKDKDGAEAVLGNCITTLLMISVLLTIGILIFAEPLLMMFGASANTLPYGLEYLRIYVIGTVFVQIVMGLNPFISAQGFPKISMLTTTVGAVINIILDPILIYGFDMGVRGAALATILAQAVSAIWVLRFLLGKKSRLHVHKYNLRPRLRVILPVLALGVSPFVMQATESLLTISFNVSLQKYGGDLAVGAMTVCASIMQVFWMPINGLTQGAQPIMSYNFGARNIDRCRKTFHMLIICCVAVTTILWGTIMLFPELPARLFTADAALIEKTSWALRIYLATGCLLGAQTACQQTFLALEQAGVSLFLALLRKCVLLIPMIFILPNFFADKVFAVFLAEPVSDALAVLTTFCMFLYHFPKILAKGPKLASPAPETVVEESTLTQ